MPKFHPLTVTELRPETRDAVVLTLTPQSGDFSFIPGQYLTFRRDFDGVELRRCYSICAGADDGALQVGIKAVDGGAFSSFANNDLTVGDVIEALPPMGSFHAPMAGKSYLAFAGGSGITPILSIIKTTLAREPDARFTLVYGNRSVHSIMFRDEINDLKDRYIGRFAVAHILESDAQDIALFSGRIDAVKCVALFENWVDVDGAEGAFICGPEPMMIAVRDALQQAGMARDKIKVELFLSAQPGRAATRAKARQSEQGHRVSAQIRIDGTSRTVQIAPGQTVLQAALDARMDAPFACRAGVCSTCKARLIRGKVEMEANSALEDYEVEAGYILTCQSHPLSDELEIDYDQ